MASRNSLSSPCREGFFLGKTTFIAATLLSFYFILGSTLSRSVFSVRQPGQILPPPDWFKTGRSVCRSSETCFQRYSGDSRDSSASRKTQTKPQILSCSSSAFFRHQATQEGQIQASSPSSSAIYPCSSEPSQSFQR